MRRSPLPPPISVLPDPSRPERVPGHRTGSGSMLLAFALSSFPQKVILLASLEVSLLQQSFPQASSPNLEPERCPSLCPHTHLRACSGSTGPIEGQSCTGSPRDCPQPRKSLEGSNPLTGFPALGASSLCSHTSGNRELTASVSTLGGPQLASSDW